LRMSLALIAGMFVKPVLYPFTAIHVIILLIIALYHKRNIVQLATITLLPVCAVLLYNYWNYERTGKFHFTSNQAFNASYYYYPFISSKEGTDSANKYLKAEREAYEALPSYKERYDHANQRGSELLK